MKRYYNAIMKAIEKGAANFEQLNVPKPVTFDIHLGQESIPDEFEFEAPAVFYNYSIDYASDYAYIYLYIVQDLDPDTENFAKDDGSQTLRLFNGRKTLFNERETSRRSIRQNYP